jgi:hypothetical protein
MATLKKRLFASVVLTFMSLMSIMLLLPRSRVDQLQKITLGTTMDGIWKWGNGEVEDYKVEETGGGIRLVVFGAGWVNDEVEKGGSGKGRSWPEVLCEEVSLLLFLYCYDYCCCCCYCCRYRCRRHHRC